MTPMRRASQSWTLVGPLACFVLALACRSADAPVTTIALGPALCSIEVGAEPSVAVLTDDRVVAVVSGEESFIVIDSLCAAVATLGRGGAGPGEFRFAAQVFADSAGGFAVVDPVLHRATHYDAALEYDRETAVTGAVNIATLVLAPNGAALFTNALPGIDDSVTLTVQRSLTNAAPLTGMRVHRPARQLVPIGEIALNTAPEYAAFDAWGTLPGGLVWVASGEDNRLTEFTPGEPRAGPSVPFERIATVDADRDRWRGLPAPQGFRVDSRPLAPLKGPFQAVVRADDGEYWMWLNQPAGYTAERYACRTYQSAELLRIVVPNAHKVLAIGSTRVLVYGEDEDGTPRLSSHARVRCRTATPDPQ